MYLFFQATVDIHHTIRSNNDPHPTILQKHDNSTLKTFNSLHLDNSTIQFYSDKSVIFLGMVHNSAPTLPHILQQLNEISCIFKNTFFVFFESNSVDNTNKLLHDWSMNNTLKYCHKSIHTEYKYPNNIYKKIVSGDAMFGKQFEHGTPSRVARFVAYRNMLLQESQLYASSITTDYIMIIDLDIYHIDFGAFLLELKEFPYDIMCSNGVDKFDSYRDTFASVELNHNWIFRPYYNTKYHHKYYRPPWRYKRLQSDLQVAMPRTGQRYERMQSCFGGLAAYKMTIGRLKNIGCRYLRNEDVQNMYTKLQRIANQTDQTEPEPFKSSEFEWLGHINQLIAWSNGMGPVFNEKWGSEVELCEHLSFHYCLNYRGNTTIAIAKNAKLYYAPLTDEKPDYENKRGNKRRSKLIKRQTQFVFSSKDIPK